MTKKDQPIDTRRTYEQMRQIEKVENPEATFISFDGETWEGDQREAPIIEVGWSIAGKSRSQQTFHYILQEAIDSKLYNHRYVPDNRDYFQFGNRKRFPRLGDFYDSKSGTEVASSNQIGRKFQNTISYHQRNGPVFIIFHDPRGDLKTLSKLGIDMRSWSNVVPPLRPDYDEGYPIYILDTVKLFSSISVGPRSKTGLIHMCSALGVNVDVNDETLFHNAGETLKVT